MTSFESPKIASWVTCNCLVAYNTRMSALYSMMLLVVSNSNLYDREILSLDGENRKTPYPDASLAEAPSKTNFHTLLLYSLVGLIN